MHKINTIKAINTFFDIFCFDFLRARVVIIHQRLSVVQYLLPYLLLPVVSEVSLHLIISSFHGLTSNHLSSSSTGSSRAFSSLFASSSHLVFGVVCYIVVEGWSHNSAVTWCVWNSYYIHLLFIFPLCDLRWLLAMATGLCGLQNTGPDKSPCLSTSLTSMGGLFPSEMRVICVLMVVIEYLCGGICHEHRLNVCMVKLSAQDLLIVRMWLCVCLWMNILQSEHMHIHGYWQTEVTVLLSGNE